MDTLYTLKGAPTVKFFAKGQIPAFVSFGQTHTTPFGHVDQSMYFNDLEALKTFANHIELAIAQWEQDNAKAAAEAAANVDAAVEVAKAA